MPTYDYECDACGHTFEEWQSFKDDALTTCPKCKKKKLRRLFGGGAAIIFKGSGFYDTDYRQKDEAAKKKAAGVTESKDDAPAEAKPDAKADAPKAEPAAATESKPEAKPAAGKSKKKADK